MKKKSKIVTGLIIAASILLAIGCDTGGGGNDNTNGSVYNDIYNFKLRDTGPAGGLIFYINPNADADGWKYLEAAPAITEWTDIEWGDYILDVGGNAVLTGIGAGQAATDAIVEHMEGRSITGTAAQVCDELIYSGYEDWFLPSRDELYEICWVLHSRRSNIYSTVDNPAYGTNRVGGFAEENYWSSSERSAHTVYDLDFEDGADLWSTKAFKYRVRAVRAF